MNPKPPIVHRDGATPIEPNRIDIIANVMQALTAKGHKNEAAQVFVAYMRSTVLSKVKCEDARLMIKQYADKPEVLKAFTEDCQGHALDSETLRHEEPRERERANLKLQRQLNEL